MFVPAIRACEQAGLCGGSRRSVRNRADGSAGVRKGRDQKGRAVVPTAACLVTTRLDTHTEDDGFETRRLETIDAFVVVH